MSSKNMAAAWARVWREDSWVRPYFKQYKKPLALALGLGVGTAVFSVGLMVVAGYLMSAAAEQPASIFELMVPLALVQLFGLGKPFLRYFERLESHDWVLRMTSSLRLRLYRAFEGKALFWDGTRRLGEVLGLLTEDIGHVQNLYLRCVFPCVTAWAAWLLAVIAMGLFSWPFALVMLACLAVLVVLFPLVSVLVNGARQARAKQLRADMYADLADSILGISDWVYAQRGEEFGARARAAQNRLDQVERPTQAFSQGRDLAFQTFAGLVALLVLAGAAALFAQPGVAGGTADWIAALVVGFFPLVEVFAPLPEALTEGSAHADAVERLNGLDEPTVRTGESAGRSGGSADGPGRRADGPGGRSANKTGEKPRVTGTADAGTGPASPAAATPEPAKPLTLRIEDVHFSYPGEPREVLCGASLTVGPGERVAVLGPSGGGKSTLASLVRGDLAPSSGRVTLGGVDTSQLGDSAPRYFGVIQQSTYLFNTTLLENLRVAKGSASREEAQAAIERVGLGPLVARLPQGLDTMVDEAGMRFSGGERHRIALARVLLQDAPVVLLDEPTVGLDPLTERDLMGTLLDALEGRTVLMITHHLLGVSLMDRVAFLENGAFDLVGAPADLERTSPRYRQLLSFDRGM